MADAAMGFVVLIVFVIPTVWFIWFLFDTMNLNRDVYKTRQKRCKESGHHSNCSCANWY